MPEDFLNTFLYCPLRYSVLYSIIDRNIDKESVREFIHKKREMFYLEVKCVVTHSLYLYNPLYAQIAHYVQHASLNFSHLSLFKYALAVKKEEITKLEEQASREEKKLAKAEKLLEDDAALFDTFLKENDKNSVEAIRM